jgi:4-hydroxy-tetrahydrodipicolinate reductase
MGQRLVAVGAQLDGISLAAALDSPGCAHQGADAGELAGIGTVGVVISDQWPTVVDVVIDFSVPAATGSLLKTCTARRCPLVFATTGLSPELEQQIVSAAQTIPIVKAASMSTAVNIAMKLAEIAGRSLRDYPTGADVEIIERHHRFKEDSPSGTALAFGKIVADAMGLTAAVHGRSGRPGERPHNEIGYHAVRTGDNPGEHTIVFGMLGETIELKVAASNRDCYAHGAFQAAQWIVGKKPGLYSMADVLGL